MRQEPDVDLLHEMAFAWSDIERDLEQRAPAVYEGLRFAYRVEAVAGENGWGDPNTLYDLYFNGEDERCRAAARIVKDANSALERAIKAHVDVWDWRYTHNVRVLPPGREGDGVLCRRQLVVSPLDDLVTTGTQHLDSASMSAAWTKAIERRTSDPEGAITAARALLEST